MAGESSVNANAQYYFKKLQDSIAERLSVSDSREAETKASLAQSKDVAQKLLTRESALQKQESELHQRARDIEADRGQQLKSLKDRQTELDSQKRILDDRERDFEAKMKVLKDYESVIDARLYDLQAASQHLQALREELDSRNNEENLRQIDEEKKSAHLEGSNSEIENESASAQPQINDVLPSFLRPDNIASKSGSMPAIPQNPVSNLTGRQTDPNSHSAEGEEGENTNRQSNGDVIPSSSYNQPDEEEIHEKDNAEDREPEEQGNEEADFIQLEDSDEEGKDEESQEDLEDDEKASGPSNGESPPSESELRNGSEAQNVKSKRDDNGQISSDDELAELIPLAKRHKFQQNSGHDSRKSHNLDQRDSNGRAQGIKDAKDDRHDSPNFPWIKEEENFRDHKNQPTMNTRNSPAPPNGQKMKSWEEILSKSSATEIKSEADRSQMSKAAMKRSRRNRRKKEKAKINSNQSSENPNDAMFRKVAEDFISISTEGQDSLKTSSSENGQDKDVSQLHPGSINISAMTNSSHGHPGSIRNSEGPTPQQIFNPNYPFQNQNGHQNPQEMLPPTYYQAYRPTWERHHPLHSPKNYPRGPPPRPQFPVGVKLPPPPPRQENGKAQKGKPLAANKAGVVARGRPTLRGRVKTLPTTKGSEAGRLDAAVQELRAMYEGGSNEETQNEDLLGA